MNRQPISMFILAWVELVQALLTIITLGFYIPEFRARMLFDCSWFEKLSAWEK